MQIHTLIDIDIATQVNLISKTNAHAVLNRHSSIEPHDQTITE